MAKKDDEAQTSPTTAAGTDETITSPEGQPSQMQLQIDESKVETFYSSTARVYGSAEELIVDFSQGIRPSGQNNVSVMRIDSRVILSPWAAKRLALALGQAVQRYEQTYGILEIDPRRRAQDQGAGGASTTSTDSAS